MQKKKINKIWLPLYKSICSGVIYFLKYSYEISIFLKEKKKSFSFGTYDLLSKTKSSYSCRSLKWRRPFKKIGQVVPKELRSSPLVKINGGYNLDRDRHKIEIVYILEQIVTLVPDSAPPCHKGP